MTKFLTVMFLAFTSLSSAYGQWKPATIATMKAQTPKAVNLDTPGLGTFWGGFRRYLPITHNDGGLESMRSTNFAKGKIDIYVSEKKTKAPLYIFMPGIFGQPSRGLTPEMIDHLEAIGGHVLVVPNLLSPPYVLAHPQYGEDPIALEIQVMEEALNYMTKRLGKRMGRVHVIAESLGTAIGSAWAAYDRTHERRLYDLTLFSPPLELPLAMVNFDKIIDEHRPAAKRCSSAFKLWTMVQNFVFQEYPGPVSAKGKECLGAVVLVDGFVNAAQKSWQAHVKATKAKGDDPNGFEAFFRQYRPELWKLIEGKDERLSLGHWMTTLKADKSFPLRIMTSSDDFLNGGLDWAAFQTTYGLKDEEIIIVPWGGHSGAIGVPEFREILRETFSEEV